MSITLTDTYRATPRIVDAPSEAAAGGGALAYKQAALSADLPLAAINTPYDGPSLSLEAGTWLLTTTVTLMTGPSGATNFQIKLWDGVSPPVASTEGRAAGATNTLSLAVSAVVELTQTTTYKVTALFSSNNTHLMKAAIPDNPAGNNASQLVAVKIA